MEALAKDYIGLEERYGAHNYHPLDVVVERASGSWVTDVDGKRYLDCLAAYSAVNQGHCHPRILQAMVEQAQKVTLTSRAFRNDQLPLFYEELHALTGFEMALPMNSGTEAVESAIKVARKWGYSVKKIPEGQAEIIVCGNNFHGRTISIVSFSSEEQYKEGFGPYLTGFKTIPFGGCGGVTGSSDAEYMCVSGGADSRRGWCADPEGRVSGGGEGDLHGEQRATHYRRNSVRIGANGEDVCLHA